VTCNFLGCRPLDYDFRCFFMDRPRVELYRRIDTRCEEMLRDGMLRVRCSHESACTARVYLREHFSLEAETEDAQAAELSLQNLEDCQRQQHQALEHARHNTQTRGPNGSGRVLSGVSLRAQECMQLLEGGLQPNSNSATRAIGYRQGLESLLQWQADPASLTPSSMVGLKVNKRKPIP